MRRPRSEGGFALPVTLFVVALVTIMLATAFVRVRNDYRISDSSGDMVDAAAVAQAGLAKYMAQVEFDDCDNAIRPVDGDSVRFNLTGGYADVVAHVTHRPADTLAAWTYVIRSAGHLIRPARGAEPQAQRTVAQFAQWRYGSIQTLAAYTSASGMDRDPNGPCPEPPDGDGCGEFRGRDHNYKYECRVPDIPAIRVPSGSSKLESLDYFAVEGSIVRSGTDRSVAEDTDIDWLKTITGGIVPDENGIRPWDSSYPVQFVKGDATINCAPETWGYGLLIVTGNLTITGNKGATAMGRGCLQWNGVVIVGKEINFWSDDQRFDGLVISGMIEQLPDSSIGRTEYGGNFIDIDFDSYEVRKSLAPLAGWAPVGNAWVDNWTTY
jgi:hypothetical protein